MKKWRYLIPAIKAPIIIFLCLFGILVVPFKFQCTTVQDVVGVDKTDSYYLWTIDDKTYQVPKYAITESFPEKITIITDDNKIVKTTISITYKFDEKSLPTVIKNFNLDSGTGLISNKVFEIVSSAIKNNCRQNYSLYEIKSKYGPRSTICEIDNSFTQPFGILIVGVACTSDVEYPE